MPSIIERVPGRRLVRARDLRPLRRAVHRPSRHAAASSPTTASRAIRCARTSRSPASSRCATTTSRSAWSTTRCGSRRNSAISISCRRGRARTTSAARRREGERLRQWPMSDADVRRLPLRRGAVHRDAEGSRSRRVPLQHVPEVDGGTVLGARNAPTPMKIEDESQPRRLSLVGMGRALLLQEVRHACCSIGWSARDMHYVSAEALRRPGAAMRSPARSSSTRSRPTTTSPTRPTT